MGWQTVLSSRRRITLPKTVALNTTRQTACPADTDTTRWIQNRANQIIAEGLSSVKRIPLERAMQADTTREIDLIMPYVKDLQNVVDMQAIASAGLHIGVDPWGVWLGILATHR